MAWYQWYQTDLPCEFSVERTRENREYLERVLRQDIISGDRIGKKTHPLLNEWETTGANAFLQVNSLAEDLRLLEGKASLAPVLGDLCDEQQCLPTWHLLHTAALFERGRPGSVLEFVTGEGDEIPDFVVDVAGDRVPVEAKLLTQSEDERRFDAVARRISQALGDDGAAIPAQTAIYVILKQPVTADISGEVIRAAHEAVARYKQSAVCERGRLCNIFLEPATPSPGFSEYRILYVLAPVPDSEDVRVLTRAKKASNQLRSLPSAVDAGILSVGLTDNQDGAAVFAHLSKRIKSGRFGGISGFLLVKRRTHLAPPRRTVVDLLEFRRNPTADRPLRGRVPLRPLAAAALLTKAEPHLSGIRAYRLGVATGRVEDPSTGLLQLPDIRVLTADLIK